MPITEDQISAIVERVVSKIADARAPAGEKPAAGPQPEAAPAKAPAPAAVPSTDEGLGCFPDVETAVKAAEKAYWEYKDVPLWQRKKIIEAIRDVCRRHLDEISRLGVEETGMGRVEDKIRKNRAAIEKTPGVEDLEPIAFTGDDGLTILERAPYGVIGSITPSTNPSETTLCNGIGMIAGGNSIIFCPHPSARKTTIYTINLMNQAIISEGGPPNLLTTTAKPTIESAQQVMKHPRIGLLVVTGGPAVVATAMRMGKRVVAAGPGNPPVLVDETADPDKAASDIIKSASTDNNIICVIEKEIIVLKKAADVLKKALIRHGAVELNSHQAKRLEKIVVAEDGKGPNKSWVGKDVQLILKQIGMDVDPSKRLAITETGPDHPFARLELLMPVVPLIRVDTFEQGLELSYELEDGCFHTAAIHSNMIDRLHRMAIKMNTSIFVKNGPALAGLGLEGEGPTSFTIASPTGEGVTTARHFTRIRRCVVSGYFRIV
jgi:acyl-CoA reductase-like NAD-dependent aldehyde dehydrogenase